MSSATKSALLLLLALSASPVLAEPPPSSKVPAPQLEEAKRLAKQGAVQYNLGRFGEAADAYAKSYEVLPTPGLLFNLGQCHLAIKDYERAIFFFEGYLRDKPDASNASLVNELIAEARHGEAEAKAHRDEEAAARRSAFEAPAPPPTHPVVPARSDRRRLAAVAVGGTSFALVGASVYLGLRAQMLDDAARAQPGTAPSRSFASSRHDYVLAASVVGGTGVAGLVASGVLAYFGWRNAPRLGASVGASSATFSVSGTW